MRFFTGIASFCLMFIGCDNQLNSLSPIEVEQSHSVLLMNELCNHNSLGFDNYILTADPTADSTSWWRYVNHSTGWEHFGSTNTIEVPTNWNGPFQWFAHANGDTTLFGRFDMMWCYRWLGMPQAFSPEGDGINDYWQVIIYDYPKTVDEFYCQVSTTDGMELFSTGNPEVAWDGSYNGNGMPSGTYLFYVSLETTDETFAEYSGTLTLLR